MKFFRCRYCGWTQPTLNPSEAQWEGYMSCCPACQAEHPEYQDYLDMKDREESEADNPYQVGDAVIAHDGGWRVTGVISDVYDDVVDVDYFDTESKQTETMDFHISCIEPYEAVNHAASQAV